MASQPFCSLAVAMQSSLSDVISSFIYNLSLSDSAKRPESMQSDLGTKPVVTSIAKYPEGVR